MAHPYRVAALPPASPRPWPYLAKVAVGIFMAGSLSAGYEALEQFRTSDKEPLVAPPRDGCGEGYYHATGIGQTDVGCCRAGVACD